MALEVRLRFNTKEARFCTRHCYERTFGHNNTGENERRDSKRGLVTWRRGAGGACHRGSCSPAVAVDLR